MLATAGSAGASGRPEPALTRVDVAALLAVAQDHAFGQPAGAQLRATVLSQRLAASVGVGPAELATTWWAAALRFLGCTGHAFETAVLFGDEVALRAESLQADFADPAAVLGMMLRHAGPGRSPLGRAQAVAGVLVGGRRAVEANFRSACEVADAFAVRLGLDDPVRASLAATSERWNGRGLPSGEPGAAVPRPMRVAQLCQELEVLARVQGIGPALATVRRRAGRAYDPELAEVAVTSAWGWWEELSTLDPWDEALRLAPPSGPLDRGGVRNALLVLADFADLKSPWSNGHSRAVAALARAAGGPAVGSTAESAFGSTLESAALVHDLGRVAVPNPVCDKPGPLTRDERDRMQTHTLVTDQLLRRVPFTARLAATASAAHERLDGSGYHRRLTAGQLDDTQRVLAAADCYQAMRSDRPYRAQLPPATAAAELRGMVGAGLLDGEAVERVLAAAGHRRAARPPLPAGLTAREAEVLRLLALGLTTRQVADRLTIAAKTADHHVQHVYAKIGVSTRGAAALFAMEHGLVAGERPGDAVIATAG